MLAALAILMQVLQLRSKRYGIYMPPVHGNFLNIDAAPSACRNHRRSRRDTRTGGRGRGFPNQRHRPPLVTPNR